MKPSFWKDFKDVLSTILAMILVVLGVVAFVLLIIVSGGLLVTPIFIALMLGIPLILAILIHILCMFLGLILLVVLVRLERVYWNVDTMW